MATTVPVSVIIPVYNAESSIARAVGSVFEQSVPPQEIVVVDDGSSDGSAEVIKGLGDKVRYLYQSNAGASAARNHAIREAHCEWIAFLDADDTWKPNRLERQFEVLDRNPDLVWAAGSYTNTLNGRIESHPEKKFSDRLITDDVAADALELMGNGWSIWTGTLVVRREVFDEVGDFDIEQRTSHDLDLWIRIAAKHPRLVWILDPIADYEINATGLTLTSVSANDPTLIRLYQRAFENTRSLSAERQSHLKAFARHHSELLLRDSISASNTQQARQLIRQFDELGISVSSSLRLASWVPGGLISTLRTGKAFITGR